MKRLPRTIVGLTVVSLLLPGLGRLAYAQVSSSVRTYTISGSVGLPGVVLRGLPGDVVSTQDGTYRASVPYDWRGVVTPAKAGYHFDPPSREYSKIEADFRSQDYVATAMTFTISGQVGAPRVFMTGLPGEPVSDENGVYSATVPYGWAGEVRPQKEGYIFSPVKKLYSPVTQDFSDDYTAKDLMVTITDTIRVDDEPIPKVLVTAEPGGYSTLTDAQGTYTLRVPHGWGGLMSFTKAGYEFDPPAIPYNNVTTNVVGGKQVMGSDGGMAPVRPTPIPAYPRAGAMGPADDVLIIPTREVAAAKFTETREDMQVMLNILREKLSEPRMILGTLYDYGDFFGGGRGMEAVYLQGYGAVFVMRVDFPLLPTTGAQGQEEQGQKGPADPVWQRARDRLHAPPNAARYGRLRALGEPQETSFEQFREELLKTLKHAANIRNVEPNETVILTVVGQSGEGSSGGFFGVGGYGGGMGGFSGGGMMSGTGGGYGGGVYGSGGFYSSSSSYSSATTGRSTGRRGPVPAPGAIVLTLQAKKGDIDAFAKGGLDLEQFRQKVKAFTY